MPIFWSHILNRAAVSYTSNTVDLTMMLVLALVSTLKLTQGPGLAV